ncbi:MAG: isoprenyl transferase [Bacteroidia bacterium]|jgi:undecaprenyl diphosphate synthase|nr:isoprenyl transferase [Bacteroidia bacterium]
MSIKEKIDENKLPEHIAVIMDGNGRWAKGKGKFRIFGHQNGVRSVRDTAEACAELGVKYLTLYAFSTENWNRPKVEVMALMELLVSTIKKETPTLMKNNIKLSTIGNILDLPPKCIDELTSAIEETKNNTRMTLVLALSYSSKWDITEAVKKIALQVKNNTISVDQISDELIAANLSTAGMPNPELMIRTSGEHRISNFLLWELAYSEFYFTDKLWPDFTKDDLYHAIVAFQNRERRFGKTSEQIKGA